jgi:uncharacterized glyoxalase superfamily protein PhnB
MKSPSLKAVTEVTCLAPQFLVDDLSEAIGYYRDQLGFEPDFVYESFYASVSRDGFSIHLKCAPKTVADRTHRKQNEHLDAYVGVRGIEALFDELKSKGAHIIRSLEERPWGCKDFYVEDLDGYLLCFSEDMWFWCNFSREGRLSLFQLLLTRQALLPIPVGSWPLGW